MARQWWWTTLLTGGKPRSCGTSPVAAAIEDVYCSSTDLAVFLGGIGCPVKYHGFAAETLHPVFHGRSRANTVKGHGVSNHLSCGWHARSFACLASKCFPQVHGGSSLLRDDTYLLSPPCFRPAQKAILSCFRTMPTVSCLPKPTADRNLDIVDNERHQTAGVQFPKVSSGSFTLLGWSAPSFLSPPGHFSLRLQNQTLRTALESPLLLHKTSFSSVRQLSKPQLNFHGPDAAAACTHGKNWSDLLVAASVFSVCASHTLVRRSQKLLDLSCVILGKKLTMWLVKHSVYKVFCGGESLEEVLGTMDKLESRGVKTVLDYAVEASSEDVTCITDDVFDHNLHLTWKAVETVSKKRDGLVAVKVSALGPVSTFERAGVVIAAVERLFAELCGMPVSPGHRRTLPDLLMLKELTRQAFVKGMRKLATEATVPVAAEAELNRVFDTLLAQPGRGEDDFKVSFFQWTHFLQPQKVGRDELAVFKEVIPPLSDYDADHVVATQDRLFRLCKMTAQLETKPSLLVDAEQSQVQGFISTVTSNAQKRFNKNGQSLIYNTYQAYLKETKSQVRCDIEMARRFGVSFALKLVRGAYMSFERDIAEANGYPCPVHDCIEDTHDSFDSCVRLLLENRNRVAIFIGTHNAESIRKAGELLYGMRQNPDESLTKDERTSDVSVTNVSGVGDRTHLLAPTSLPVSFGQLLGMGDNLTFTLSDSGFRVYKYVPYGPVEVTIPYLLRRVQENCGVIGRAGWELQIIVQEIKRRAYSWLGCHKQQ